MFFIPNYFLFGAALVAAGAIAMPVNAAEIKIMSTPAASTALRVAAADFERATGHKVGITFSSIATTRKRVAAGEDFDMLVVSPKAIDDLTQEGKLAAGTSHNMGRTGLAIVGHKGSLRPDISTVESLKRTLLDARLFAYSATGESGIGFIRVPNMMKHVCVAARIGDGKAPGEGNSYSIAKTSNAASADSGSNPSGWHEFWPITLSQATSLE